ncbi:MAG: ribosome maturation factor RimM [Eubacteriales bacterium]|jgi:16S rRNA processing protein RimM
MPNLLETGRIINTHGVHGEVKLEPWADSPDFLKRFSRLYLPDTPYRVLSCRTHGRFCIVALEGVNTVEDAMKLKNRPVFVDRAEANLPEGSFFIADILGFDVYDLRTARVIGKLAEVLELPAGNVYRVDGPVETLIPARPEFTRGVDFDSKTLTVETIPGMGDEE